MKRILAILLACCAVLLCACGSTATNPGESAGQVEYASQEAFLKDMAAGITRLNNDEDSSKMNAEEKAALYQKLVGYELDKIEKYQDAVFEDEDFNQLAHIYISACQMQRYAAQCYKNNALYESLWSSSRSVRSAVITELYSRYGLPITSEQAANYSSSPSYTVTFSSGSSSSTTDYIDCVSVKELAPMWNEHYSNADYYHNDLAVTNDSADCSLEVTVSAAFYDGNGDVVGSDRETLYALGPGETQYCELRTDVPYARSEYKIEKAEKGSLESGMSDLSFKVTTPSNKVMVQATNNGQNTIEWGCAYCVFYNGKDIVDVDNSFFATSSDPIEPGETQFAECSTKKAYTSYELYYYGRLAN